MKFKYFLVFLFFICIFPAATAADKKTILIIESYHSEYPWDASYLKGIKTIMGGSYRYVSFQMDTKRLPKNLYMERAEMAWKKYVKIKPDLVILGDDNALKLLGPRFGKTNVPVVYLGINNNPRIYNVVHLKNMTGVLERPLLRRSVVYLRQILNHPPKKILILFDSGTTSRVVAEGFKEYKDRKLSSAQIDCLLIHNFTDWKTRILGLKNNGYDAVIIGLYHTIMDDDKKHVKADRIIKWTSEHTPIPMFCFWDFAVGPDKSIGGYVLFGETMGRLAGQMALEIFSGKKPQDLQPIYNDEGRFYFSQSQLAKWGLNLPEKIYTQAQFTE